MQDNSSILKYAQNEGCVTVNCLGEHKELNLYKLLYDDPDVMTGYVSCKLFVFNERKYFTASA